jgi:predicted ribosomally synthesized peptide with SipW-like signal peptide
MKKIILSLTLIGLTIGGVTAATVAYFTDTATLSGTTFSTSTMDLAIDSNPAPDAWNWVDNFASGTTISGLYPGYPNKAEHNWQVLDLKNIGTVDGNLTLQLNATSWSALGDNLVFTVSYDSANNGTFVPVTTGTLAQFAGNTYTLGGFSGVTNSNGGQDGKMASVKIEWSVPGSAGNDIQGKSVTIDAVFGLEQTH